MLSDICCIEHPLSALYCFSNVALIKNFLITTTEILKEFITNFFSSGVSKFLILCWWCAFCKIWLLFESLIIEHRHSYCMWCHCFVFQCEAKYFDVLRAVAVELSQLDIVKCGTVFLSFAVHFWLWLGKDSVLVRSLMVQLVALMGTNFSFLVKLQLFF